MLEKNNQIAELRDIMLQHDLFNKFSLTKVAIFGSTARGETSNDIDILIEDNVDYRSSYEFREELQRLTPKAHRHSYRQVCQSHCSASGKKGYCLCCRTLKMKNMRQQKRVSTIDILSLNKGHKPASGSDVSLCPFIPLKEFMRQLYS